MPIPLPDFQSLLELYAGLPEHAKIVVGAVGEFVLAETFGKWWEKAKPEERGGVLAPIYREWRDSLLESEASDEKLAQAFEEFFCRQPVRRELDKVLHGRYRDVDYQILRQQLHESCELVDCPVPGGGLVAQIDLWVRGLKALLEQDPEYQAKFQPMFRESLSQSEHLVHNDSLARELYLNNVEKQQEHLWFSGMPAIGGTPDNVQLVNVFVMPDVLEQPEFSQRDLEKSEPTQACNLLTLSQAPRRVVILGGPGSGKTTLLQSFCLAFAQSGRSRLTWAQSLPELLPVFYRIRELEEDLRTHTTIWDCIAHRCSQDLSRTLPPHFFPRQMESAGLIVFFDGLDEAKTAASRTHIVQLIESFVRGLSPECRVMITSRPYDYRHRFIAVDRHFQLREFTPGQIQQFIEGWQYEHVPDRKAAREKGDRLWKELQKRPDIMPLARNALLLTMIVRVHFGMGVLPDSRVSLYAKCSETLLQDWWQAAGLSGSTLDRTDKEGFLSQLAFDMQSEFGEKLANLEEGAALRIGRRNLAKRLKQYLQVNGPQAAVAEVDNIIDWLHRRDGILVHYGEDENGEAQFGFLHRSFQEYFAALRMAQEPAATRFEAKLKEEPTGWNETLYLAVAQLADERRREIVLDLVKRGRADFAWQCLKAGGRKEPWLRGLVEYLARYYWFGSDHDYSDLGPSAKECAEACIGHVQTIPTLQAMFKPKAREGQSLAAAVELAEALAELGSKEAQAILKSFFGESARHGLDSIQDMAPVDDFFLDKYLVTNQQYERMIPGHRKLRGQYSDADDQPVIYVNWHEARLFCRWRGPGFRLPTEEEWYRAAAGEDKREYPWGDEFDPSRCNTWEGGLRKTTPVGAYPEGVSAYGCYDMAGNVWEWSESRWSEGNDNRVLRGGAWYYNSVIACSFRIRERPHCRYFIVGFRCART